MRGKPQSTRMELMPQQVSLVINSSHLSNQIQSSDSSKRVIQENKQAQHIPSPVVDSAVHFLKISGFSG